MWVTVPCWPWATRLRSERLKLLVIQRSGTLDQRLGLYWGSHLDCPCFELFSLPPQSWSYRCQLQVLGSHWRSLSCVVRAVSAVGASGVWIVSLGSMCRVLGGVPVVQARATSSLSDGEAGCLAAAAPCSLLLGGPCKPFKMTWFLSQSCAHQGSAHGGSSALWPWEPEPLTLRLLCDQTVPHTVTPVHTLTLHSLSHLHSLTPVLPAAMLESYFVFNVEPSCINGISMLDLDFFFLFSHYWIPFANILFHL